MALALLHYTILNILFGNFLKGYPNCTKFQPGSDRVAMVQRRAGWSIRQRQELCGMYESGVLSP